MATAAITLSATASGLPEGGVDEILFSVSNTSAANTVTNLEVTTALASATPFVMPSSAKFLLAIPPATMAWTWNFTISTAQFGQIMSSGLSPLFMAIPGGSTVYFLTTDGAAGATTFRLRIITY